MTTRLPCLTACALGLMAVPAEASCVPAAERQHVRRADAVFTGRVLAVRSDGRATFRVLSVRKGPVERGAAVRVRATPYPSSITLGWEPRVGQRWRIYADRQGGRWTTNDCMGTRRA